MALVLNLDTWDTYVLFFSFAAALVQEVLELNQDTSDRQFLLLLVCMIRGPLKLAMKLLFNGLDGYYLGKKE